MADAPEEQGTPVMLRDSERTAVLTFIHNIDLPRWALMDAQEKQAWTAFNLRYMVRQLDKLAAQLAAAAAPAPVAKTPVRRRRRR